MKIRLYKDSDREKIKQFIAKSIEEIFNTKALGLEDLDNIRDNFEKFWVLEDKSEIIGTIGIKNEKGEARISRLYIKKSERGKNLGRKLMEKVFAYCKKHKFKRIFLTTYKKMNSQGFYEKLGFKVFKIENMVGRVWLEKF